MTNKFQPETAFLFNCPDCGEVWDVDECNNSEYRCHKCANVVTQIIIDGVEKIYTLTENESDELALRESDRKEWENEF